MAYLLDANVFIAAKNLHYGFDFCPAFWDWVEREHQTGIVASVEKVGDELLAVADELATWAKQRPSSFFPPADPSVFPALSTVGAWVRSRHYEASAIATFTQVADYYLVSQALAGGHTVVTHEVPSGSKRKVQIPDVCIGLGIKCIQPFQMLRAARARFVL